MLGFLFFGEGLFTPFQLAWVTLTLDILAPIALLSEPPSDVILLERPYERKELLMTGSMRRFIILNSIYNMLGICELLSIFFVVLLASS